jgi:hypothetical protein
VRHPRTLLGALLLAGVAGVAAGPAAGPAAARPAVDPDPWTLLLRVRLHERVRLHKRPRGRVVAVLGARTELGSRTVLTVLARRGAWAQVSTAVLGGRRAWLRIDGHVARRRTRWELRADASERSLAVIHDGRVLHTYRVAHGRRRGQRRLPARAAAAMRWMMRRFIRGGTHHGHTARMRCRGEPAAAMRA